MQNKWDFKTVMNMLKKYWWWLLLTLVIGAGLGYFRSETTTQYRATARVYVSKSMIYDKRGNGIYIGDNERFWQSIHRLSKTRKFKQQVKAKNKNFKSKSLTVDSSNGSNIVNIKYHGKSIKQSIAITQSATVVLKKLFLKYNDENAKMTVIDKASKKTAKKTVVSNRKSKTLKDAFYGIFLGFLLALAHFIFIGRKHSTNKAV